MTGDQSVLLLLYGSSTIVKICRRLQEHLPRNHLLLGSRTRIYAVLSHTHFKAKSARMWDEAEFTDLRSAGTE